MQYRLQNISQLVKENPVLAKFILPAMGILAFTAIFMSWNVDTKVALTVTSVLLGIVFLLIILFTLLNDPIIKRYALIGSLSLFFFITSLFTISIFFPNNGVIPPIYCLIEPFKPCIIAQQEASNRVSKQVNLEEVKPPSAVERTSQAAVKKEAYRVYIQFGGVITVDQVKILNSNLKTLAWRVESNSGERVESAKGFNEVRYGRDEDKIAAQLLASDLNAKAYNVGIKKVTIIKSTVLEVWISK